MNTITTYTAAVERLEAMRAALERAQAAATGADTHEAELASLQAQRAQVLAAAFTTGEKPDVLAIDAQIRRTEKAAADARSTAADARAALPVLEAQVADAALAVNAAHLQALDGAMLGLQAEFDTHVEDYFKAVDSMRSAIVEMEAISRAHCQLAGAAGIPPLETGRLVNRAMRFTGYDREMALRSADGREYIGALSTHGLASKRDRLAELKATGLPMHRVSEPAANQTGA